MASRMVHPLHAYSSTKLLFFRVLRPYVYRYCLGADLQASRAGRQSPNRCSNHHVVCIEYRSQFLASYILYHLLKFPKHMIVDIIRLEDGLVKYRDTFPGGPAAFFADVSQMTYVVKNAIYILHTLLGDGVVVGPSF
jgi:hypothetical protein